MVGAVRTLRCASLSCVAWAMVCCATLSPNARGAEEASSPPKYLSLDRLDAYLELQAEFAYRRVNSSLSGQPGKDRTQKNREWGFQERVGFDLGGWILDPKLVSYDGSISFALTQDRFEEDVESFDRTDRDNGYLSQYDLRVNIAPGHSNSGSIYGLRQEDRINRRFQPTLNRRRNGFGNSWVFNSQKLPMELSYDYLETDRTGNADRLDDERFTESTFHYGVDWLISDHHRFKLAYEHAKSKQEYQGMQRPFETTRDLLTLEHQLEFGDQHKHSWRTLLRWQEESGDFARDLFEIGPQLTLKHSDNLQTFYKYQFNREEYEGLKIDTHRADFQVVHQMYTNLTTTVDLFGLYEDVEKDIRTTQYGASIDWQYNRRNRFGHLHVNLALAYDTEDVNGDNGRRMILDEAHALRDPISISLRNRNVIFGTVVVTDSSNRRIYQLGLDYAIARYGNVTRIIRIKSGRIVDGDTILVDYQIRTPSDGKLDSVRTDLSIEQRMAGGLTPYYRLSYRNQEDDTSSGFLRRADRTNHHRLGVNYESKSYTLGAEFEIFDDSVDPYDAFHFNGLLRVLQDPDHSLDASTRISRLFFEGGFDDRNVTMVDMELDHRWRLSDSLSTLERIAYRLEDDSIGGTTHSWDVTAGLEYAVGDLSGELTFEYDRLDLPHSEEDDFGVFLRLRREIRNVLSGR